MVFKQSGHCISFSWVVSWTICTGFFHYELSNITCMEQECKVAPLFEVLVDFFGFTQSHSKIWKSVQIVLDGTLSSESVVPFVHCLLLLKMDPVCTYGNDLCQTKEDELGAKYQPDPLSSQLQSWPELVFTVPPLFCLLIYIFSGSVRHCQLYVEAKYQ